MLSLWTGNAFPRFVCEQLALSASLYSSLLRYSFVYLLSVSYYLGFTRVNILLKFLTKLILFCTKRLFLQRFFLRSEKLWLFGCKTCINCIPPKIHFLESHLRFLYPSVILHRQHFFWLSYSQEVTFCDVRDNLSDRKRPHLAFRKTTFYNHLTYNKLYIKIHFCAQCVLCMFHESMFLCCFRIVEIIGRHVHYACM